MASLNLFKSAPAVFAAAIALRIGLLIQGYYQDRVSALKFTDIDYFVFTDAARHVSRGRSPYLRDTYRYTPLLAWLLVPTSWSDELFTFGKVLFAVGDIVTGWLILTMLRRNYRMSTNRALKYASLWLLNPMVAIISARGSSEGVLAVIVMALLWATLNRQHILAGFFLGFAVHFKIYPFIYAASISWWLFSKQREIQQVSLERVIKDLPKLFNRPQIEFTASSIVTFAALNAAMYLIYGDSFLEHTFFYHLIRSDHRHNFSPYNILLYANASDERSGMQPEVVAFLPQILLCMIGIPLALAWNNLASAMLAQTLAFVSFNKVCTSQYFLWYMVFLPFYLPDSSFLKKPLTGIAALALWIGGQGLWLHQGFRLEFLGISTFLPGLWLAGISFFVINVWITGVVVSDARKKVVLSKDQNGKRD